MSSPGMQSQGAFGAEKALSGLQTPQGLVNPSKCLPACGKVRKVRSSHGPSSFPRPGVLQLLPILCQISLKKIIFFFTISILLRKGSSPSLPPRDCCKQPRDSILSRRSVQTPLGWMDGSTEGTRHSWHRGNPSAQMAKCAFLPPVNLLLLPPH